MPISSFVQVPPDSTGKQIETQQIGSKQRQVVSPQNFTSIFRDSFDSYTNGVGWVESLGVGDIIRKDGNAAGASYLVISKDPLTQGTVTTLTTLDSFEMPLEVSIGAHMSQRTLGQEISMEIVSTDEPLPDYVDVAISSIQQATTTLTVTTATAHGLSVGNSIGIYGVADSRMNYPSLVVASTPTPTQFTVTAGPSGTIPSLTVGPFASGFVTQRQRLGLAQSGMSQIFEMATATTASLYVRSDTGDVLPSGTVSTVHGVSVASTASVQLINSAYNYTFQPTTEYRFVLMADRVQFSDITIDGVAASISRLVRSQVVPNNEKNYRLRFRLTNNKGLTVPVAKIISMQKTGTTTATVTTDVAHGLTTADLVNIYGSSDQTNYANLLTATAVSSIVSPTQFTIVIGTAVSSTVYGGYVARVNGGNLMSALGGIAQVAVSATLANAADGTQALTLTGNTTWAGLSIGDYVNVHGLRSVTGLGSDLNCDGAWQVRNVSTTVLELGPIGNTVPPANFGPTVCGGAIIKRTDLRLSFVRIFDFDRLRVEMLPRPGGDIATAIPVTAQGGTVAAVTTVSTVSTVSSVTSANFGIPLIVADIASAAITTTTTTAAISPSAGSVYSVVIPVTAVTGTNPTMDVVIQESDDTGVNWFDVYHFPRITATGVYRSPPMPLQGNRIRYIQTINGTTPSFTRAINRLQSSWNGASYLRQLIDRSISLTTLDAVTSSLTVSGCKAVQLVVAIGAATVGPTLQLEGSVDNGLTWYALGAPLLGVALNTVQLTVVDISSQLIRARVSVAGNTVTPNFILIKGF